MAGPEGSGVAGHGGGGTGGRSRRLTETFELALDHTVSACSEDAMLAAYPTLAPELVATAHRQLERFLRESPANEFRLLCAQREMDGKLDALDALMAGRRPATAADMRVSTAGKTTPEEHVRAQVMPAKEAEAERLRAAVAALERQNELLARDVAVLRQQFNSRLASVGQATTQLDGLLQAAAGLNPDEVRAIVQTIDGGDQGEAVLPRKRSSSGAGTPAVSADGAPTAAGFVMPALARRA